MVLLFLIIKFFKSTIFIFRRESPGSPTNPTNPWDGICGVGRDLPNPGMQGQILAGEFESQSFSSASDKSMELKHHFLVIKSKCVH